MCSETVDDDLTYSNVASTNLRIQTSKLLNKTPIPRFIRNGYRQRAAGLCYRLLNNSAEVLLVSGRNNSDGLLYWVLPGGGIEKSESAEQAVLREVKEEAGVSGRIVEHVGTFFDEERFHETNLYILAVVEIFDEWDEFKCGRKRAWATITDSLSLIKNCQMKMLEVGISML